MLREVEHQLRILAWQQTEDGQKRSGWQNYPERLPLTDAERAKFITDEAAQDPANVAPSVDEVRQRLGW